PGSRRSASGRSAGSRRGAAFSWGGNVAANDPSGDDGQEGGRRRQRAGEGGRGEDREVRLLTHLERADLGVEPEGAGTVDGQHAQRVFSFEARCRRVGPDVDL